MYTSYDCVTNIVNTVNSLSSTLSNLRKQLSILDREISDKYHDIEKENFNVVQGYKLAKELKVILTKRRAVKGELAKLQAINSTIQGLDVNKVKESYERASSKHNEIKRSLNLTYDDCEILSELAVSK